MATDYNSPNVPLEYNNDNSGRGNRNGGNQGTQMTSPAAVDALYRGAPDKNAGNSGVPGAPGSGNPALNSGSGTDAAHANPLANSANQGNWNGPGSDKTVGNTGATNFAPTQADINKNPGQYAGTSFDPTKQLNIGSSAPNTAGAGNLNPSPTGWQGKLGASSYAGAFSGGNAQYLGMLSPEDRNAVMQLGSDDPRIGQIIQKYGLQWDQSSGRLFNPKDWINTNNPNVQVNQQTGGTYNTPGSAGGGSSADYDAWRKQTFGTDAGTANSPWNGVLNPSLTVGGQNYYSNPNGSLFQYKPGDKLPGSDITPSQAQQNPNTLLFGASANGAQGLSPMAKAMTGDGSSATNNELTKKMIDPSSPWNDPNAVTQYNFSQMPEQYRTQSMMDALKKKGILKEGGNQPLKPGDLDPRTGKPYVDPNASASPPPNTQGLNPAIMDALFKGGFLNSGGGLQVPGSGVSFNPTSGLYSF